jgi:putative transposase
VVQETFINDVSTRKNGIPRSYLRDSNPSFASQVSEITKDLSDQLEWFRTCPLEKEHPVIWVDVIYKKVYREKQVISIAIAVAMVLLRKRRIERP